jgi:hypothetical protein
LADLSQAATSFYERLELSRLAFQGFMFNLFLEKWTEIGAFNILSQRIQGFLSFCFMHLSSSSSSSSSMARQPEVEPWPPLNDASKLACL